MFGYIETTAVPLGHNYFTRLNFTKTEMDKIALLKKVQELARRGVGGEMENAKRILAELMERHGITADDLNEQNVVFRQYETPNELDMFVFKQVCASLFGSEGSFGECKARYKSCWAELTEAQHVSLEMTFEFYKIAFIDEFKALKLAFCMRHDLFPKNGKPKPLEEATQDEQELYYRANEMKTALKKRDLHKRLNS